MVIPPSGGVDHPTVEDLPLRRGWYLVRTSVLPHLGVYASRACTCGLYLAVLSPTVKNWRGDLFLGIRYLHSFRIT